MRKIDLIIIHCSATREGKDFRAADIDRWHRQQGFKSIGYHFVVRLNGEVERGRPIAEVGAHCKGHNATSIGVCYIGGLAADGKTPKDTRTVEQRKAMRNLVKTLKHVFPKLWYGRIEILLPKLALALMQQESMREKNIL